MPHIDGTRELGREWLPGDRIRAKRMPYTGTILSVDGAKGTVKVCLDEKFVGHRVHDFFAWGVLYAGKASAAQVDDATRAYHREASKRFRYMTETVGRDGNPYEFAYSLTPLAASEALATVEALWPRDVHGVIDLERDPEMGRWIDLDEAVEEQLEQFAGAAV